MSNRPSNPMDLAFWIKDSATAWDKCEERRLECERLRAALDALYGARNVRDDQREGILRQVISALAGAAVETNAEPEHCGYCGLSTDEYRAKGDCPLKYNHPLHCSAENRFRNDDASAIFERDGIGPYPQDSK